MAALKNSRHEQFAQNLFAGMSQRAAYRDAFPSAEKWTDKTVDNRACELANDGEIMGRVSELHDAAASPLILDRQSRMIILTEIATNEELFPKARMQAIDILNKMDGDYTKKIEVVGNLGETAAKVAAILDE